MANSNSKSYRRSGYVNLEAKDVARLLVHEVHDMVERSEEMKYLSLRNDILVRLEEARVLLQK